MTAPAAGERAAWAVAVVLLAAWLALVEVFWLPLRVAGVPCPLSIAAAVAGNLWLPRLALRYSGSRLVAVLPAGTWLVVVVGAMVRRPEGDLVMSGVGVMGVVNLAFLMLGVLAAAFSAGRALGGPRPQPGRPDDASRTTDGGTRTR
jgi:hypothetical protein